MKKVLFFALAILLTKLAWTQTDTLLMLARASYTNFSRPYMDSSRLEYDSLYRMVDRIGYQYDFDSSKHFLHIRERWEFGKEDTFSIRYDDWNESIGEWTIDLWSRYTSESDSFGRSVSSKRFKWDKNDEIWEVDLRAFTEWAPEFPGNPNTPKRERRERYSSFFGWEFDAETTYEYDLSERLTQRDRINQTGAVENRLAYEYDEAAKKIIRVSASIPTSGVGGLVPTQRNEYYYPDASFIEEAVEGPVDGYDSTITYKQNATNTAWEPSLRTIREYSPDSLKEYRSVWRAGSGWEVLSYRLILFLPDTNLARKKISYAWDSNSSNWILTAQEDLFYNARNYLEKRFNYTVDNAGNFSLMSRFAFYYNLSSILSNKGLSSLKWDIYPNPASNEIRIESNYDPKLFQVRLMDMTGRLINRPVVPSSTGFRMDVSGIPTGTYILQLEGAGGIFSKKIYKF
ncbi:MAG: T9SS type A sorting domain-containing protein [Bacteroidia bacterium]|nr:T9SS type A sorting domain-containing protein [Bacteroidia bacterium]